MLFLNRHGITGGVLDDIPNWVLHHCLLIPSSPRLLTAAESTFTAEAALTTAGHGFPSTICHSNCKPVDLTACSKTRLIS